VQHGLTGKMYAMKAMSKELLFTADQEKYVLSERDIMLLLADSTFVPSLYATLQDEKSIYFVTQFFPGGDLFSILYSNKLGQTKAGGIASQQALFYAANVLAAICHMHDHEVVFRDVKPENMVSDDNRTVDVLFVCLLHVFYCLRVYLLDVSDAGCQWLCEINRFWISGGAECRPKSDYPLWDPRIHCTRDDLVQRL
jgi:serine/threonine protein kinase